MFDTLMLVLVVLSFGCPVVPWLFAARWGARGIWYSTGVAVVVLLGLFPVLFESACVATACGQGAIAIFILLPIWIAAASLTIGSATIAYYGHKRQHS